MGLSRVCLGMGIIVAYLPADVKTGETGFPPFAPWGGVETARRAVSLPPGRLSAAGPSLCRRAVSLPPGRLCPL